MKTFKQFLAEEKISVTTIAPSGNERVVEVIKNPTFIEYFKLFTGKDDYVAGFADVSRNLYVWNAPVLHKSVTRAMDVRTSPDKFFRAHVKTFKYIVHDPSNDGSATALNKNRALADMLHKKKRPLIVTDYNNAWIDGKPISIPDLEEMMGQSIYD